MTIRVADLFAGAGGSSTGARMIGAKVVYAANHWPAAVEIHAANHPDTLHVCQDLHQADFSLVPEHDIMLASPSCQGHSRARGKDQPRHDKERATSWAVVSAAEICRPRAILVENVQEMRDWVLFDTWCDALRKLGYQIATYVHDAADFGVPQNRERLFICATLTNRPLDLSVQATPHQPINPYINWEHPKFGLIETPRRAKATLERIAAGRAAHGDRFLAPYYQSGSGKTGRSVNRPIGTITTKARWAVINGDQMRMLSVPETVAAMGFPADYQLPPTKEAAIRMLGNAVPPPMVAGLLTRIQEQLP